MYCIILTFKYVEERVKTNFVCIDLCQSSLDSQRAENRIRFRQQIIRGVKLGNLQYEYRYYVFRGPTTSLTLPEARTKMRSESMMVFKRCLGERRKRDA